MIARISAAFTFAGSSAGLLVSTMTTGWPSSTPSMIAGFSRPQRVSMKAASVLGSPKRTGLASVPAISVRYQAQMMGDPVESVSGDLWPENERGHGMSLRWEMQLAAVLNAGGGDVNGAGRRGAGAAGARRAIGRWVCGRARGAGPAPVLTRLRRRAAGREPRPPGCVRRPWLHKAPDRRISTCPPRGRCHRKGSPRRPIC